MAIQVDCKKWYNAFLVRTFGGLFRCKVVPPPPPPPPPSCGCSDVGVPYRGATETIINGIDGHNDIRALINWDKPDGDCTWLTDEQVRPAVKFNSNQMTVKCIPLKDGVRAHYLGCCQPSAKSPLISSNPGLVASGTLRLVFESRKPA